MKFKYKKFPDSYTTPRTLKYRRGAIDNILCGDCGCNLTVMTDSGDKVTINYGLYKTVSRGYICRRCIENLEATNPDFAMGLEYEV